MTIPKRKLQKTTKKTKSFVANYNHELQAALYELASIYRGADKQKNNLHGFLVRCIKNNDMVRVDENTKIIQKMFMSSVGSLATNLSQLRILIDYISASESLIKEFQQPIIYERNKYKATGPLKDRLKKLESIKAKLNSESFEKRFEDNADFIALKDRIITLDRTAGLDKKNKGTYIRATRIKLELNLDDYKILENKASYYFKTRAYTNIKDKHLVKPNKSAALIQLIHDCSQLKLACSFTDNEVRKIKDETDAFNESLKTFNACKKNAIGFKPADLFDVVDRLYRELTIIIKE